MYLSTQETHVLHADQLGRDIHFSITKPGSWEQQELFQTIHTQGGGAGGGQRHFSPEPNLRSRGLAAKWNVSVDNFNCPSMQTTAWVLLSSMKLYFVEYKHSHTLSLGCQDHPSALLLGSWGGLRTWCLKQNSRYFQDLTNKKLIIQHRQETQLNVNKDFWTRGGKRTRRSRRRKIQTLEGWAMVQKMLISQELLL